MNKVLAGTWPGPQKLSRQLDKENLHKFMKMHYLQFPLQSSRFTSICGWFYVTYMSKRSY